MRIRVDVDEALEFDVQPRFFARLTDSRARDLFAPVHITAGKHPEPVTWFDCPPHQHDPVVLRTNDRPDSDLRVEVQHLSAPPAHEAFGLTCLQLAVLE